MAKLIFGCGYLGLRVARLWLAAGDKVYAVTRSAQRAETLAAEGLVPIVADMTASSQVDVPQEVRTVLWAVGYGRSCLPGGTIPADQPSTGDSRSGSASRTYSIHDVYVGGLAKVLPALPPDIGRLIYISSTGVYGQVTSAAVDESSPCQPTREGGLACLAAEELLRASSLANKTVILRLAGIYGPDRIPRSKDLLAGTPINAPNNGWLNLIHVDDAARIVVLAEEKVTPPKLYVVSDGQPVIRGDYYRELARLLGAPPPRFVQPPADSPAAARAASDKRVNPRRLFAELSPALLYPSYREGLAAICKTDL
jgi:nucleoside-diphosphate-sugar epimerase